MRDFLGRRKTRLTLADIERQRDSLATLRGNRGGGVGGGVTVNVEDCDARAFAGVADGNGFADSGASACHDGDMIL